MPWSSVRVFIDPDEFQANWRDSSSARHVRRFLKFLTENPNRPLCIAEICATLCVRERTLRGACEKQLGMGPIRYLTLHRMHQVRHALLSADASNTTVTDVAIEHGFSELGRFSVAYRSFFYESPSETLSRLPQPTLKMAANPTPANSQVSKNGSHVGIRPGRPADARRQARD